LSFHGRTDACVCHVDPTLPPPLRFARADNGPWTLHMIGTIRNTTRRQDQVVSVGLQLPNTYGSTPTRPDGVAWAQISSLSLVHPCSCCGAAAAGSHFWLWRDGCRRGESLSTANCDGESCCLLPAIVVVKLRSGPETGPAAGGPVVSLSHEKWGPPVPVPTRCKCKQEEAEEDAKPRN